MRLRISEWIASCFKVGYLPLAPGTWGSIFAILLWWVFLKDLSTFIFCIIIVFLFFTGIVVSNTIINHNQDNDPSYVIIDELVGQWIALLIIPDGYYNILIIFVLFRFFDILKIFPANIVDKRFKSAFGVILDDLIAGIYTIIILYIVNAYY